MQDSLWQHQRMMCYELFSYFSNPTLLLLKSGGHLVKDVTLVSCTQSQLGQYLTVPTTIEDDFFFMNKYSLVAIINHSGTLTRGHCWACIKNSHSLCCYSWSDKWVFNVDESSLNSPSSYLCFYRKILLLFKDLLKYDFVRKFCHFTLSLGVTNPTYNPSPI